jgi:hypothetical protein
MAALGIASYSVVMGLLSKIEDRGVLSRSDIIEILDGALAAIEDLETDDDDVRLARKALERQIKRWRA